MHREAYGHDTPHVNVATVRVQLGKVSCALGKRAGWDEATELLEEAESHLLEARDRVSLTGGAVSLAEVAGVCSVLGFAGASRWRSWQPHCP